MQERKRREFPPNVLPGSYGAGINSLLSALCVWATIGRGTPDHGIICDGVYGTGGGGRWIAELQKAHGLPPTMNIDMPTRHALRESLGFDFEEAVGASDCTLIQHGTGEVYWQGTITKLELRKIVEEIRKRRDERGNDDRHHGIDPGDENDQDSTQG